MPSLRKRVSSYLRQLSFHNEPREKHINFIENTFINKYLQGEIKLKDGPIVHNGKVPTDLPSFELGNYKTGSESIVGCYTGPDGGLAGVKRKEKHLSLAEQEIDFIDTQDEQAEVAVVTKTQEVQKQSTRTLDNTTMVIKMAGQEYFVTNKKKKSHNKSHSLGSLKDFEVEIDKTKRLYMNNNNNCITDKNSTAINNSDVAGDAEANMQTKEKCDTARVEGIQHCDNSNLRTRHEQLDDNCNKSKSDAPKASHSSLSAKSTSKGNINTATSVEASARPNKPNRDDKLAAEKQGNYGLAKSKSEGNPFRHQERQRLREERIRQYAERPSSTVTTSQAAALQSGQRYDPKLPTEWNRKTEYVYGVSDSLYDKNLSTKVKNGNPIADCFGIIMRNDSSILAVADGVNWGEKAAVAAKSAVHGCLHYLNKTIFLDTRPFENLVKKSVGDSATESKETPIHESRTSNTQDVFVCLLRAFNCAHDLILENNGMLTTLTVAIVLPLKNANQQETHVVCVCNVGDSLAYVYSQKHGIRELTKGSHDITSNRDMRDALGALGPVDGIKPELSNLTLSVTTLQVGDIVIVASDGLTDNFDPTVCKFAVNSEVAAKGRKPSTTTAAPSTSNHNQQPQKPPRKNSKRPVSASATNTGSSSLKPIKTVTQGNKQSAEEAHNPLIAQFLRDNPIMKSASTSSPKPLSEQLKKSQSTKGFALLRSKTALDFRSHSHKTIPRNADGLPYITPVQKYEITLLLIEDILKKGISGKEHETVTAKKLCENLISFTMSITNAKRRTLEDNDLYFNNQNGVLVEISSQEKKIRRKRALERVQNLPGKLDHVTVVACNVGNCCISNV